ncbi:MAG: hypothetical protein MAG458_01759 [Nitrosopumilus sp.]|nr:hypothetical protein [Nitrosopumilus sp.]
MKNNIVESTKYFKTHQEQGKFWKECINQNKPFLLVEERCTTNNVIFGLSTTNYKLTNQGIKQVNNLQKIELDESSNEYTKKWVSIFVHEIFS